MLESTVPEKTDCGRVANTKEKKGCSVKLVFLSMSNSRCKWVSFGSISVRPTQSNMKSIINWLIKNEYKITKK